VCVRVRVRVCQPDVGTDQLPEDERKKFEKEFDEYREKLDRAKEECVTHLTNVKLFSVYSAPVWVHSIVMCMSVPLSVCLSALLTLDPHIWTVLNFPFELLMAVARSSSARAAVLYVAYH